MAKTGNMTQSPRLPTTRQAPLRPHDAGKRELRTQFAALCWRLHNGKPQVLLITSRGRGRWILPKGWGIAGKTPAESALREAWEEAGVEGKVMGNALGIYSYTKPEIDEGLPCVVAVFPILVKKLRKVYPESGERERKWFTLKKAANLLAEPELKQMVRDFDPTVL